jgi:hypothetical protein
MSVTGLCSASLLYVLPDSERLAVVYYPLIVLENLGQLEGT